jgi:hypothetical protein
MYLLGCGVGLVLCKQRNSHVTKGATAAQIRGGVAALTGVFAEAVVIVLWSMARPG